MLLGRGCHGLGARRGRKDRDVRILKAALENAGNAPIIIHD
jgi:hypothetical protein